jgi:hypothetical protein
VFACHIPLKSGLDGEAGRCAPRVWPAAGITASNTPIAKAAVANIATACLNLFCINRFSPDSTNHGIGNNGLWPAGKC